MSYNIEKEQVIVYKLRKQNTSNGWADITVDGNGSRCRVSISSDYGKWSYYWGACGSDYKKFLCGLGMDYVSSKFGEDRFFCLEETIKHIKNDVLEQRREDYITDKQARLFFDAAVKLEDCSSQSEFEYEYSHSDLTDFSDGYPDLIFRTSPLFKKFWETAWKAFTNQLQNELKPLAVASS